MPKLRRDGGLSVWVDEDTYALLLKIAEQEDRTLVSVLRAAVKQLATVKRIKEAS
jgi:predicted transcriptional regulator